MLEGMGHPVTRDSLLVLTTISEKKRSVSTYFIRRTQKNPRPMPHL